ncbi:MULTISPECIES: electron transport complex subunit RsxG [Rheinheimera]|jgi:electron transport complex protein RnfG|uniref:Ion-translocating oxidoreductase complex subunit G n=1 Tax=Rheinheimera tangshanensis TaxID=400153 RepID=A0A5C8LWS1_9GAMM|nr:MULTISPECIES: electron transport complex subunit RsxG [Rheinheimera]KOO58252.1 electron transporter RnfG [Rheinheimera sp. KL1]TXK80533.1 electron transport complex subunit RsxG [Rheinheimera tangshanensis]GGM60586.1 electron transport complex subunit G [Rheinheimera tangshanensis]
MLSSVGKNALLLGTAAVLCVFAVAAVNEITKTEIEQQQLASKLNTLVEVMPELAGNTDILKDCVAVLDTQLLGKDAKQKIYRYRTEGQLKAYLMETTAPDGYSGAIEVLAAISPDSEVIGVRVLSHKETPGLGDKVELRKTPWILSFNGQTVASAEDKSFAVKKDGGQFDQFAGATITPRAVVKAVKNAAVYIQQHPELASLPADCGA